MPTARGGLGAAMVGGVLVAMGGEAPTGNLPEVEAFDVRTGTWSSLPPMRTPRHGIGVASVGSAVYAMVGGTRPGLDPTRVSEALNV